MKSLRAVLMLGLALPAYAQYAGPAILSRGEAPAAMNSPSVDFTFSLAATANYTNGLLGVATNSQGQLVNNASYGAGLTIGLSGAHTWRHTHLGVNFSASAYDYASASYFAGISQGLSFDFSHQFSRHILFSLRENAGWFTQFPPSTVSLNSAVSSDPTQSQIPTTDFYDNRTIYSTTLANLVYQISSRLSISLGGGYFTTLRRSSELYSATGESASADAEYRLSRRVTMGAVYDLNHFSFSGGIGHSWIYTSALSFSDRFDRWTELSFYGGASRVASSFEQAVPLNPAFVNILCPPDIVQSCNLPTSLAIQNNTFWAPNFGVRLSRSFQRGVAYLNAGESITPGNGLFLTSRAETAGAGYGYSGLRKWNANVGFYYIRALSLGNVQGGYGQITGFFSVSRELIRQLSVVTSFNATHYNSPSYNTYNRLIYTASIGLGYSSRDIPLRFF